MDTSYQHQDRLVVGVDFGTTFSGVAEAYSGNSEGLDSIRVLKSWPGGNTLTSDKVPSEIAYGPVKSDGSSKNLRQQDRDSSASTTYGSSSSSRLPRNSLTPTSSSHESSSGIEHMMSETMSNCSQRVHTSGSFASSTTSSNSTKGGFNFASLRAVLGESNSGQSATTIPRKWGYQVIPNEPRLQCMKLMLDERLELPPYVSKSHTIEQLRKSGKRPVDITADYLTEIFNYAKDELSRRYGELFVSTTALNVVLTVPAIWSDAAKDATLKAARRAGMGEDLHMISEPEAAAVYALRSIEMPNFHTGDNFIVCDAGGGTVDLISYEVKSKNPLQLEESTTGSGSFCGAVFLNMRFEEYIRDRLGRKAFAHLCDSKPRSWQSALKYFEDYVKRNFDPTDPNHPEYDVPFNGVADNIDAGIEGGYLTLTANDIEKIFGPCIQDTIDLVQEQKNALTRKGKRINGVILVGGFGQSGCLYKCMKAHFSNQTASNADPNKLQILQPKNAWTAVVRGAVLRGLETKDIVISRKSRCNYGRRYSLIHDSDNPNKYPREQLFYDELEEAWFYKDVYKWFIKRGETVSSCEPGFFSFYSIWETIPMSLTKNLLVCDVDDPPTYKTHGDQIREHCTLHINLEDIPRKFFKPHVNSKGQKYFTLGYLIGVQVESAALRFDLRVDGVIYGKVTAKFLSDQVP